MGCTMLNLSMKECRTAEEEILQRLSGSNELENSLLPSNFTPLLLPSNFTPLLYYQRKEKFNLFPYLLFCITFYLHLKV